MERNYLKEILTFQNLIFYDPKLLSSGQKLLWYALMDIDNRAGWITWFTAANVTLMSFTGLSRQSLFRARRKLKYLKLIEYRTNGTKATSYKMLQVPIPNANQEPIQEPIQVPLQEALQVESGQTLQYKRDYSDEKKEALQEALQEPIQVPLQEALQEPIQEVSTLYKQKQKQKQKQKNILSNSNSISYKSKVKNSEAIKTIIDYLNSATDSSYRSTTKSNQKKINARLNEGFTVEDFKTVIDKKVSEWQGTDMAKYIRPETLFGTKFGSYLNQKEAKNSKERDYGW